MDADRELARRHRRTSRRDDPTATRRPSWQLERAGELRDGLGIRRVPHWNYLADEDDCRDRCSCRALPRIILLLRRGGDFRNRRVRARTCCGSTDTRCCAPPERWCSRLGRRSLCMPLPRDVTASWQGSTLSSWPPAHPPSPGSRSTRCSRPSSDCRVAVRTFNCRSRCNLPTEPGRPTDFWPAAGPVHPGMFVCALFPSCHRATGYLVSLFWK
jgi:hypothetical protein